MVIILVLIIVKLDLLQLDVMEELKITQKLVKQKLSYLQIDKEEEILRI